MTLIQFAIARHKAQLEKLEQKRPLRENERRRLKLLRAIVAEYESKERSVQSGT